MAYQLSLYNMLLRTGKPTSGTQTGMSKENRFKDSKYKDGRFKNPNHAYFKVSDELRQDYFAKIRELADSAENDSEESKKNIEKRIDSKIKSGRKLSAKEMNYLQKHNPELYRHMRRVQLMRESLKERLKHCKTKQQAQAVITQAMAGVSKKDPAKQAMFAMIGNIQNSL